MATLALLLLTMGIFAAEVHGLTSKELDECLRSHNKLRYLHEDTPALEWDSRLATDAQRWSDHLASVRSGYHDYNRNDGSGESWWYKSWPGDLNEYSCANAVRDWYDEIKDYNWQTRRSNGGVVGHFTQLVWKDVKKVGVGISLTKNYDGNNMMFIVARYDLQGNTNKINGKWVTTNGRADMYKAYGLEVLPRKPGSVVPSIKALRDGKGKFIYATKTTSTTTPTSTPSKKVKLGNQNDECLRSHNKLRFLHEDTPALEWDSRLAADAQRWSDHLASVRSGYHDYNRRDGSGESWWYKSWSDPSDVYSCANAVRDWYDEIKYYNWQTRRSNGGVVGHFTQLVWKDVKKVGVGISPTKDYNGNKMLFIVARYDLQGNTNKIDGKWVTNRYGQADMYKAYGMEVKPRKKNSVVPSIEALRKGRGKFIYATCLDSHTNCQSWARRGECDINPSWMHDNCEKSCNMCGKPGCTDLYRDCQSWANRNECNRNPTWMEKNCKNSCNVCGGKAGGKKGGTSSGGEAEGVAPTVKSCTDKGEKIGLHCDRLSKYCGKSGGYEKRLRYYCECTCAGTWASRRDEFEDFDYSYELDPYSFFEK